MATYQTFPQRIGYYWTCVMLAEALSDDLLAPEPEMHSEEERASLRTLASANGLSFCKVLRMIAPGLYWADVAATPDLCYAYRVVLTEEHLMYAMPWDCRMDGTPPGRIRAILKERGDALQPARQRELQEVAARPEPPSEEVMLRVVGWQTISMDELQEAIEASGLDSTHLNTVAVQQTLLSAVIDALMRQLYAGCSHARALVLKARITLIAALQRWQRHTRQMVVKANPVWSEQRQQTVCRILVGLPELAPLAA